VLINDLASRHCDQQLSAIGPVIHIVLRPSNGWLH